MQFSELLEKLGYDKSPNFLWKDRTAFDAAQGLGHIFRRAAEEPISLKGVYGLRPGEKPTAPLVPVVYVCRVKSEELRDEVHRLVWNQDIVPFVIVYGPHGINLYSGFRYRRRDDHSSEGVLRVLQQFRGADQLVEEFHAEAIDSGLLWRSQLPDVTPERRVNWKLLDNLKTLDRLLQKVGGLKKEVSHALIGKYIYLHYLRDRQILSQRKLTAWGIAKEDVFGSQATLAGVEAVVRRLDEWLNGRVFPLDFHGKGAPYPEHLRWVAGVFSGEEISAAGVRQLHVDFQAYDFSYIPIETLSVIYEQFLHAPDENKTAKGKEVGAYYTPIPVVNFMLAEMEDRKPLQEGMRVLDASCGSGAFLVQTYRRLIEKTFPANGDKSPRPRELRDLLERHIFGVDCDEDACSVTELSLILTLLDYVDPPDLENIPTFTLPVLRDCSIFHANFFKGNSSWRKKQAGEKFDWIIGNPPWKQLKATKLLDQETAALDWIKRNAKKRPVGKHQLAQAFAWEVVEFLAPEGEIALFLPAMSLFEDPSRHFRSAFFRHMRVHAVANFANLAEVLSAGRFRVPAMAIFYRPRHAELTDGNAEDSIVTYSPLVANQECTRPMTEGKRNETWCLVVNASEVRDVGLPEVIQGSGLAWKLATWGSHFDRRLLARLERRLPMLERLEKEGKLTLSEGIQLRANGSGSEAIEPVTELIGKNKLDVTQLSKLRHFFDFPKKAIRSVEETLCYARKGRVQLPLSVCRPPHVIVSAARNFAVYSEGYLIIPPRQIGIVSPQGDKDFLRALALYLNSDFVFYHQFLTSTQFGVQRGLATLRALKKLPIPLERLSGTNLKVWTDLHSQLAEASRQHLADAEDPLFAGPPSGTSFDNLLRELNALVSDALELGALERSLINDLVEVRLELNDGKVGRPAIRRPQDGEIRAYATSLKSALDDFLGDEIPKRHEVAVVHDAYSAMVQIDLTKDLDKARLIVVRHADKPVAAELENTRRRLQREHSQWVYFNRDLRVFEGLRTYVLKPMQRFHWTESQALIDAGDIIADTLTARGDQA